MATVHITVNGMIEAIGRLEHIHREIPKAARKDTKRIANILGVELRKGMKMAGIQAFRGFLKNSTYPIETPRGYKIGMSRYAAYFETMPTHQVWGYKHPIIRQWMLQKHGIANYTGPITVSKKPFIEKAVVRTARRIRDELQNGEVIKTVRRKGR